MNVTEMQVTYKRLPVARHVLDNSSTAVKMFGAALFAEPVEVFKVFLLDTKNVITSCETVSRGSLCSSTVHPRDTFVMAVHERAAAIICMHNHPSGDPTPSAEDKACTARLYKAGQLLGIRLLDHIIVGENDYFSFADAGRLVPPECVASPAA